jgi:hypothetical protein
MVRGPRWSSSVSAICPSCVCPAVRPSRIGRPCASTTTWILVVRPPRDRPRSDLRPPFCRRGLLVGANGRAVDHLDVAVMRCADNVHQPVPHACLSPSHEAIVAGGTRTITLGQVAPWRTRSQHPEDAVQHAAVIHARHASRLVGQQRLDHAPLEIGQVIPAHIDSESELPAKWKRCGALVSGAQSPCC